MPYDANGNYTLPAGYKAVTGTTIDVAQHNPPFEDVQAALNAVLMRDGRAPWTGNQNANANKLTNLADGTAAQDAATFGQIGQATTTAIGNVPAVTDWTSQQAVGAKDADARYVQQYTDQQSVRIDRITYNTNIGAVVAYTDSAYFVLQPYGNYLRSDTSQTLVGSFTATQDVHVGSWLYANTITPPSGLLGINGAASVGGHVYASSSANSGTPGDTNQGSRFISSMVRGNGQIWFEEVVGSSNRMAMWLPSFGNNSGNGTFFLFDGASGRISSSFGQIPFTADMTAAINAGVGTCVSQAQYSSDFYSSDGRVTNLPNARMVQNWQFSASDGQRVNFPTTFASPPVVQLTAASGVDADCATTAPDASGFTIRIWGNGGNQVLFSCSAFGSR